MRFWLVLYLFPITNSRPFETMFFFFFGSISPKIKRVIQPNYGPCLNCRSPMDWVEMENTLEILFIPVWSFSSKEVLLCGRCGLITDPNNYEALKKQPRRVLPVTPVDTFQCVSCGAPVSSHWRYCPTCGVSVDDAPTK